MGSRNTHLAAGASARFANPEQVLRIEGLHS